MDPPLCAIALVAECSTANADLRLAEIVVSQSTSLSKCAGRSNREPTQFCHAGDLAEQFGGAFDASLHLMQIGRVEGKSFSSEIRSQRSEASFIAPCHQELGAMGRQAATKLRPDPAIRTKDNDSLCHAACEETLGALISSRLIVTALRRQAAPQYLRSGQLFSSQRFQTIVSPHMVQALV